MPCWLPLRSPGDLVMSVKIWQPWLNPRPKRGGKGRLPSELVWTFSLVFRIIMGGWFDDLVSVTDGFIGVLMRSQPSLLVGRHSGRFLFSPESNVAG